MAFRLIPKDVKFYDLFVADGDNLALAAERLNEMVQRFDRLEERVSEIQALEKRGDEIDEEINRRLDDAFVTPFDREDIHELVVRLDDVVDIIQAVAETFVIYDVHQPTDDARRLTAILHEQGVELAAAMRKLNGMRDINRHLEQIHELEHEADGLSRSAIGRLFRESTDAIEVIKWRELYGSLEGAIDAAEDAAEAIERMQHKGA